MHIHIQKRVQVWKRFIDMNGEQLIVWTIMNAYRLKDIISRQRHPAIIVSGYRFNKDVALFSAILIVPS